MRLLFALGAPAAGFIFAVGLGLSGMTRPQKVVAFLDVGGAWDPSLALVMVGAIGVYALAYRLIMSRGRRVRESVTSLNISTDIDAPLFLGAGLFGVGWGIGGFCPGPAVVSLVSLRGDVLVFVASMGLGMLIWRFLGRSSGSDE